MFNPAGQSFNILTVTLDIAVFIPQDKILYLFTLHQLVINIQPAVFHLYLITGKTDDSLDVIGFIILGKFENHDIPPLRPVGPDTTFKQGHAERQGMFGIAVSIFGHKQKVTDIKCGIHRSRRDFKRLKQKSTNEHRNQNRIKYRFYGIGQTFFFIHFFFLKNPSL